MASVAAQGSDSQNAPLLFVLLCESGMPLCLPLSFPSARCLRGKVSLSSSDLSHSSIHFLMPIGHCRPVLQLRLLHAWNCLIPSLLIHLKRSTHWFFLCTLPVCLLPHICTSFLFFSRHVIPCVYMNAFPSFEPLHISLVTPRASHASLETDLRSVHLFYRFLYFERFSSTWHLFRILFDYKKMRM